MLCIYCGSFGRVESQRTSWGSEAKPTQGASARKSMIFEWINEISLNFFQILLRLIIKIDYCNPPEMRVHIRAGFCYNELGRIYQKTEGYKIMQFHVFGDAEKPKILLIHGVLTPWQVWNEHIEYYSKNYFVIVPALDAHTEEQPSEFISIEQEAEQIEHYLLQNKLDSVYAVCGCSMGGAIASLMWKNGRIKIQNLIMDGAPLVPAGSLLTNIMTNNYLNIIHKSKERDTKTLENFKKVFLPEKYLYSYLKIADNMSDSSMSNIIRSVCANRLPTNIRDSGTKILYIHGTKLNESLSKKSAKLLRKYYPNIKIICKKGAAHCETAIYQTHKWLETVDKFLSE